ncbi:MAG: BspA family leucine-rich repeat surface protein [Bacteroidales bacterium]|nr:BspA family leucine-rich repeat surface protein [Bacteroidales bacterium]
MKITRIIVAAAFAATLFSCTKENVVETNRVNLTFDVTNEPSDSKAVLNGNAVEFAAGDQIGVWDGTTMNCFETTAGGATASFSGNAASADSYILISPFSETNYSVNGSVVTYSIPNIQVATPGGVDPNALVSMAKVTGSGEVTLSNCVGLLKVVVPDGLTVKEIHVGGGATSLVGICGPFTFNTNNQALNYVAADKMLTSIALVPQPGQSVIAPGTYYIAVRPATFAAGLTLAYVNADNQLCKRTTSNSVTVARNHILPVGTLNTTNFTPVTGRSTLRYYENDAVQFTGLIKKLAGGTGTATTTDTKIKKIIFKAHSLPYKNGGTAISNTPNTDVTIYAWVDGDTAYVYTEAPIITLHNTSGNLFRDFAALEEVSFNDVNTLANASFSYMFRNCTKLKSVDFGNADFSKVTDFSYMFYTGTSALEYVDLGGTATTAATTMQAMFNNNQNLKYLNLGPNFTLAPAHTNMFLDAARQTSIDAAGDNAKKCQLYASQAFYDDVRANETTFNAARFTLHAL